MKTRWMLALAATMALAIQGHAFADAITQFNLNGSPETADLVYSSVTGSINVDLTNGTITAVNLIATPSVAFGGPPFNLMVLDFTNISSQGQLGTGGYDAVLTDGAGNSLDLLIDDSATSNSLVNYNGSQIYTDAHFNAGSATNSGRTSTLTYTEPAIEGGGATTSDLSTVGTFVAGQVISGGGGGPPGVPEPSSVVALLGLGAMGLFLVARRKFAA